MNCNQGGDFMFFALPKNSHVAIIGDMKQSQKMKNRNEVQIKLKNILETINIMYQEDLAAKFIITLGDEFQGLLKQGANTMKILSQIERMMYPVQLRFGIGIGRITTEINPEMALGADGPGYYKARAAIEYLKDNEKKKQSVPTDTRFEVECENQENIRMLNTIVSLMTVIKEGWSDRQREIIWDIMEHQDSQSNVANRLNIKQPAVQKSLALGNYYAYKDAMDFIGKALEEIGGKS